jgi:type IV fimbrial biogenesis protein FimT
MGILQVISVARRPRLAGGFTLVELLVTMAIAGVLLAIGVPSMMQFLADRAAAANADEFAQALRFARTEAMKRGRSVYVCPTRNPEAAQPTCSDSAEDWMSGWLVASADSDKILRVQNALRSMESIATQQAKVTFAATGIATAGTGDFVFTPSGSSDGKQVRTVNVNNQGRVKVTQGI